MKGEYGGVCGKEEGNADYGRMVQPSQQRVVPCVEGLSGDWVREVQNRSLVLRFEFLCPSQRLPHRSKS